MELMHGVNLLRLGGHFPGSCVLHWAGSDDKGSGGVLLSGAFPLQARFCFCLVSTIHKSYSVLAGAPESWQSGQTTAASAVQNLAVLKCLDEISLACNKLCAAMHAAVLGSTRMWAIISCWDRVHLCKGGDFDCWQPCACLSCTVLLRACQRARACVDLFCQYR